VTQPASLLDLLACPKCHGALERVAGATGPAAPAGLGCARCELLYGVEDGLPNMLIEDAKPWSAAGAGGAHNERGTRD